MKIDLLVKIALKESTILSAYKKRNLQLVPLKKELLDIMDSKADKSIIGPLLDANIAKGRKIHNGIEQIKRVYNRDISKRFTKN